MTASSGDALKLQRPLPDGTQKIVARGVKEDGPNYRRHEHDRGRRRYSPFAPPVKDHPMRLRNGRAARQPGSARQSSRSRMIVRAATRRSPANVSSAACAPSSIFRSRRASIPRCRPSHAIRRHAIRSSAPGGTFSNSAWRCSKTSSRPRTSASACNCASNMRQVRA
jgi:hypothetical protein